MICTKNPSCNVPVKYKGHNGKSSGMTLGEKLAKEATSSANTSTMSKHELGRLKKSVMLCYGNGKLDS